MNSIDMVINNKQSLRRPNEVIAGAKFNENVEFEITNFTAESTVAETKTSTELSWEESTSETEWSLDSVSENVSEPVMSETSEILSENEITEITSVSEVSEPVMQSTQEPVAETLNEPVLITREDTSTTLGVTAETTLSPEDAAAAEEEARRVKIMEQEKKAQERIQRLKELSMKLKTPQALNEMEKEPAYKRRNIQLENTPHSSESQISRFTLTENEEKKIEIRPNNSFLHDNVD